MTTSHRRIALLTGASLTALGMTALTASPALAAPHDALADGTYTGIDTTAAVLTICEIASDADSVPNSPCFSGVIDTATPLASAVVNSALNGQIYQHDTGAAVALHMINGGSAEVGAIAQASGSLFNTAFASENVPIRQQASGSDISLTIDNNGPLLLDAVASATGTFANAHAYQHGGYQAIHAATDANIVFNNNDDMTVLASANAHGTFAHAYATLSFGYAQNASSIAGDADVTFNNDGNLTIDAVANATGVNARATANLNAGGLTQFVAGTGSDNAVSASLNNSADGVINIDAIANASASAYATANANLNNGVWQRVTGSVGADANATVD